MMNLHKAGVEDKPIKKEIKILIDFFLILGFTPCFNKPKKKRKKSIKIFFLILGFTSYFNKPNFRH